MKKEKIYAGLDVHKDFTYATVLDEKGKEIGEGKFPTDKKGFETFFKEFKKQDLKVVFVGYLIFFDLKPFETKMNLEKRKNG